MDMMKIYNSLIGLLLFISCSSPINNTDSFVEISFVPQLKLEMTPMLSKASEIIETDDIIGLIYKGDYLVATVSNENGTYKTLLTEGYYQAIFITNGKSFLKNIELYSTLEIALDTISKNQWGKSIYLSEVRFFQVDKEEANMKSINIYLYSIAGNISFTKNDENNPENLQKMEIKATRVTTNYFVKSGNTIMNTVQITTDASKDFCFSIYFINYYNYIDYQNDIFEKCKLSSTLHYNDNSIRDWYMGTYEPYTRKFYNLTGTLQ